MNFWHILWSGLLGVTTAAGWVVDTVAEREIKQQVYAVEELQIRVDNIPSHQLVQGRVERVRIAARGLYPMPGMRIDTFELEIDSIAVDLVNLRGDERESPKQILEKRLRRPLLVGMRLVFSQEDINQVLSSAEFVNYLETLTLSLFNSATLRRAAERYELVNPRVEFLGNNRVRWETWLTERGYRDRLKLTVETGIEISRGSQGVRLVAPEVRVNDRLAPGQFVKGLIAASDRLNLGRLEEDGILSRVLQLKLDGERIEIALFARVAPSAVIWD